MELEQVDIAEGVLPVHDYVSMRRYSFAGLYTTIGLYLILPSTSIVKSAIADSTFGVVPAIREVVVVVVAHVLRQRRLRCLNG